MAFRKLTVTVIEARDLPPLDHGSVDPYVVVSVGGHFKAETHEIRRSVHPVWNAKLVLGPLNIHERPRKSTRPFNEIEFEASEAKLRDLGCVSNKEHRRSATGIASSTRAWAPCT